MTSQLFTTSISSSVLLLFLTLTHSLGIPTTAIAGQRLNDICQPGVAFNRRMQGYGVNKFLMYSREKGAENVISFTPHAGILKHYYSLDDPVKHKEAIKEFFELRKSLTKKDKLTGLHVYPSPYFKPDKGMGCKKRRLDFHSNELTFYHSKHTPRISGDLCTAEPKIIMNFLPLKHPSYGPNTLAQFMAPSRHGYFSMIEIIYSPLYRGGLLSAVDFQPSINLGDVRSTLRVKFQRFIKELTYLMRVQCGSFPKRIKLEGRAYAPKGKTYPKHRVFKDGTIEVMSADLHYFDEKVSLDNVSVGKYGREMLAYNLETTKKLVRRAEMKRILQERAATRPMTVLEAYWRKASKIDRFTAMEILVGISNVVENSICNQPVTKENRGDKYAAQCQ